LIGRDLGTAPGAIAGSTKTTAKSEMDMQFWAPKGINRFHFVGGSRFVHGGAMPQEICVPLLRINYARGEGKGRDPDLCAQGRPGAAVPQHAHHDRSPPLHPDSDRSPFQLESSR
jgi:hypothetical protein